MLLYTEAKIRW